MSRKPSLEEADDVSGMTEATDECRFFCIRTSFLRCFRKFSYLFTGLVMVNISCSMLASYHNAMVSTLEKRFDWGTGTVGFIMASNDMGYLSSVLFTAYFGGMTNRVRLIAFCSVIYGLSGLFLSLPYLLFGSKFTSEETFLTKTERVSSIPMCSNDSSLFTVDLSQDFRDAQLTDQATISFWIFMFAGIVQGVATGPFWNIAFALIDDMTKQWSGVFIGFYTVLRAGGPILGYLLASKTTLLHETLSGYLHEFHGGQKHPLWIGAWWLGYLLLGVFVIIIALPLFFFPSYISMDTEVNVEDVKNPVLRCVMKQSHLREDILNQEEQADVNSRKKDKSLLGFLKSILRLISNSIFMSLVLGNFFEFIALSNLVNYKAKYLENHFDISQSDASFFTAFSSPTPFLLGLLLSILVSYRFQMSMSSLARYHAFIHIFGILNYIIGISIACPTPDIVMSPLQTTSMADCSAADCSSCTESRYYPVCGGQNLTFYSPCVAGCTDSLDNCACSQSGSVTFGTCDGSCYGPLIAYIFIGIFMGMLQCSARTQEAVINLRCVQPRDKALALAFSSFIWGLVSSVIPPITGYIFDSFCLMKSDSQKKRSYCQLYNRDSFRKAFHGLPIVAQGFAIICFFLVWFFVVRKYSNSTSKSEASEKDKVDEFTENDLMLTEKTTPGAAATNNIKT